MMLSSLGWTRLPGDYIFQQDGTPAHNAKKTQDWLRENNPAFWGKEVWPPSSPDCNPLDYYLWGVLEKDINRRPYGLQHNG